MVTSMHIAAMTQAITAVCIGWSVATLVTSFIRPSKTRKKLYPRIFRWAMVKTKNINPAAFMVSCILYAIFDNYSAIQATIILRNLVLGLRKQAKEAKCLLKKATKRK